MKHANSSPIARFVSAAPFLMVVACVGGADVSAVSESVVYGVDDRLDVYAYPNAATRALARESVVALIPHARLDETNPNNVQVTAPDLLTSRGLCVTERFVDQPTAASCTGTLIDNDLVITAGHCVSSLRECQSYKFVFNYHYAAPGTLATITTDDVFRCHRVLVRATGSAEDYGIVQLDRPVTLPRRPVTLRAGDAPLAVGTPVTVMGTPSGIPIKIDDGGQVLDDHARLLDFFEATTDTFHSSSGSGVFDGAGQLVGVLVRGQPDYVSRGACDIVDVLPETSPTGGGEDITYIARAVEALCATSWVSDICGDTAGVCRPCGEASQCPAGWGCVAHGTEPSVASCARPCVDDLDCATGNTCNLAGACVPSAVPRCIASNLWEYNTCGRRVVARPCAATEVCLSGACSPAGSGNSCESPTMIAPVDQVITDTHDARYNHQTRGSCGGTGKDRVFQFELTVPTRLVAEATGFDTLLYLRRVCDRTSTERACVDDSNPPGGQGTRIAARLAPGTWFLFLDAFGSASGPYSLDLAFQPLGTPDAGPAADGGTDDAGTRDDTGAAMPTLGGGCCAIAGLRPAGSSVPLLVLGLLLAFRRRRRHAALLGNPNGRYGARR